MGMWAFIIPLLLINIYSLNVCSIIRMTTDDGANDSEIGEKSEKNMINYNKKYNVEWNDNVTIIHNSNNRFLVYFHRCFG